MEGIFLKQKTCRLESRNEFMAWARKVKASADYKNANEVLIKVMTSQFLDSESKKCTAKLKRLSLRQKLSARP